MQVVTIIGLAFALLVAVFAIQNSTPVTVTFLRWHLVDVSLALVILGSAAAGAVVVGLLGAVREIGLRLGLRSLRGRAERLAQELEAAREKAVSLEEEVARFEGEARAKARELEAARQRVEALEVELEATRAMEILPRPQDEAEAGAGADTGAGAVDRAEVGAGAGAETGIDCGRNGDGRNGHARGGTAAGGDLRGSAHRNGREGDGTS